MEATTRWRPGTVLIRIAQTLAVGAAFLFGVAVWVLAVTFGDCAGWKGTGTCPRVPFWDWEVFRLGFLAAVVPVAVTGFVVRPGWRRLVFAGAAGLCAGLASGAFAVLITAS